jgi:hypothetical protein
VYVTQRRHPGALATAAGHGGTELQLGPHVPVNIAPASMEPSCNPAIILDMICLASCRLCNGLQSDCWSEPPSANAPVQSVSCRDRCSGTITVDSGSDSSLRLCVQAGYTA